MPGTWRRFVDAAAGEPFRAFFPLGALAALVGVALWPLHYAGVVSIYPKLVHSHLMMTGFFGGFILGFLGTALPRILEARPLSKGEIGTVAVFWVAAQAAFLSGWMAAGDLAFAGALGLFGRALWRRWKERKDLPPPFFGLVAVGLFAGVYGALAEAASLVLTSGPEWLTLYLWRSGHVWLNEGWVLFVVLGVTPFFFPKLGARPVLAEYPVMRAPSPLWRDQANAALLGGLGLAVGMELESLGFSRAGLLVKVAVYLIYGWRHLPWRFERERTGTLGRVLRSTLFVPPLTWLCQAIWLPLASGLWHLLLLGGFAVMVLAVATRVVFGHAKQTSRTEGRVIWWRWIVGLIWLALATRITADFVPKVRVSHHIYAALAFAIALGWWALKLFKAASHTRKTKE